ncbi:MAG: GatB/YqeY domain-containing protein [Candidatus Eremiobacteraeota bacterium]|nr:GatB/YqeY domain-containing protein [Candidatus Eremiobacteraeota bacterium]
MKPSIKDTITADLKDAMRARDQLRLDTLRSVISAFNYRRIEAGSDLSDAEQLVVVQKLVKQRSDSIESFTSGNRPELAEKESREREILLRYLPAQKSPDEIRAVVRAALAGLPEGGRNQGALMKLVLPQLKGLADGNAVRKIVTEELAST